MKYENDTSQMKSFVKKIGIEYAEKLSKIESLATKTKQNY